MYFVCSVAALASRTEPWPPDFSLNSRDTMLEGAMLSHQRIAEREQPRRHTHTAHHETAISGVAASSLRVYESRGSLVICSVVPISTILPRYITAMRVER